MADRDQELRVHRDWLNAIQPVGLVVSPPALVGAQAFPDKNVVPAQQALLAIAEEENGARRRAGRPGRVRDFLAFARAVLGWEDEFVAGSPAKPDLPESLAVVLTEFGETLRPTHAVENLHASGPGKSDASWSLLVQVLPDDAPFDEAGPEPDRKDRRWHASPQARLERLLRETGVPVGLLWNGAALRLVYAPRGESSGHLTWPVYALCEVQGRPLLAALVMLLGRFRLFAAPKNQSLLHLLRESRKYQNVVSTKLAAQVLEALNELLRGFQAANEFARGQLLDEVMREDPEHVYGGLLAVILRLVFVLYAEERGLMSGDPVYVNHYALTGLFEKLRADAGRHPDTMEQRFGAWSRLCVLFRLIYDGARHGSIALPPRRGHLFDPDAWPFLEGRSRVGARQRGERLQVPKVPDGTVYRVLEKLLILDGDRLSYRALDVEQIGSVYENMMGFTLERAHEVSIGVGKDHVVVGLESLVAAKGADRAKTLKETADVELTGKALEALKAATTVDDLVAALSRRISSLTPRPIPQWGLYLQPTDERRRSGSHYTPRELTEPIVRTTLRPLLEDLGPLPTPDRILDLKVCDPAMGSGAFLVETCRQLAAELVKSWDLHGRPSDIPPDEDLLLFAQRQVAQHCLYGVDKNPFAVDLGKLSLWLATLAKGHSFSFLDHAVRNGDSLVGLSREQIASFNWAEEKQLPTVRTLIDKAIATAEEKRRAIQALSASDDDWEKKQLLREAEEALDDVRLVGDCVVACFFAGESDKERKRLRREWEEKVASWLGGEGDRVEIAAFVEELREGERPVPCFHWEIEFPEVFTKEREGFDGFVGNPPFIGGKRISGALSKVYSQWIVKAHAGTNGNVDLVAHFFRRAFVLLRHGGAFGLIATNTIRQGDTRSGGLTWLVSNGGKIFSAQRRIVWPGKAAVVVSVIHVRKGDVSFSPILDGHPVAKITALLFHSGPDGDPVALRENAGLSFTGCDIKGQGFLFDDRDADASPISIMDKLIAASGHDAERIFPYMGGEDLLDAPSLEPTRFVIDFGELNLEDAQQWPNLLSLVESKVRSERQAKKDPDLAAWPWWRFWRSRGELRAAIERSGVNSVIVTAQTGNAQAFAFVRTGIVFSHTAVIIVSDRSDRFAVLQSRAHTTWAAFVGPSMKDDPRYTPTDCFETFPFPKVESDGKKGLAEIGDQFHAARSALMVKNGEGLTATYNRFHDPDETDPEILKLRELHDAMDRAVLDAYGWTDIRPTCEFLLDYEEPDDEEDNGRARKRKKPWRYRWPDEIRDEVLARLLELNAERAKEEAAQALAAGGGPGGGKPKKGKGGRKGGGGAGSQGALF